MDEEELVSRAEKMPAEQSRMLVETMERFNVILKEARKKMNPGWFRPGQSREEALRGVDNEVLELWSKYVFFCVTEHGETLLRKRRNIRTAGDYGEVDIESWWKEIRYFLSEAICVAEFAMERIEIPLIKFVDHLLDQLEQTAPPPSHDAPIESLNPQQYEELCAEEMRLLGYEVRTTKASGDQGVDVIARKGAVTVVLQCKMYSSPVGNKAVQEVYAGKKFNDADVAAVVSNHEFTEAARQLAQALNVLLLHHSQLRAFFGEENG